MFEFADISGGLPCTSHRYLDSIRVWYTHNPCSLCSKTKPSGLVASTVRPWLTYTVEFRGRSRTSQFVGLCIISDRRLGRLSPLRSAGASSLLCRFEF